MRKILRRLKEVGPGAMVAATFIGPGTVATCTITGASYGYTLLWTMMFAIFACLVVFTMTARLGVVTNMGLSEILRAKYTGKIARIVLIVVVISAVFIGNASFQTGNLTGSYMGLASVFPNVNRSLAVAIFGVIAILVLYTGKLGIIEKVLTGCVILMGVVFLVTAIAVKPDWGEVIKGMFIPTMPKIDRAWFYATGLVGTTVTTTNIFMHPSIAAQKWGSREDREEALKTARMDSILSMILGGIISLSIVIAASAAFYGTGIVVTDGRVMAEQLEPVLGPWATVAFGVGLFAAGMSSAIGAPLSTAFACTGILGWKDDLKSNRFKIFWFIVIVFGMVTGCTMGASPTEIILFAQATNAFILPVSTVLLMIACNDKKRMGEHRNGKVTNVLGLAVILITAFIAVRNLTAFADSLATLLS